VIELMDDEEDRKKIIEADKNSEKKKEDDKLVSVRKRAMESLNKENATGMTMDI
jgi:hypothetical protein